MKFKNPFSSLTKFEWILWGISSVTVVLTQALAPQGNIVSMLASLIGAAALIFIAKGNVLGQLLMIVFAILYGIISYHFRYFGEMITYLGMSAPMAVLAAISWIKHPYRDSDCVKVDRLTKGKISILCILTLLVTAAFYLILGALDTSNLIISTISVSTSFLAASLTYLRSPYYALGYAVNDVVLIVLWVLASMVDISYLSMVICFVMFLVNDLYGFINWRRMQRKQSQLL
jgi:nicotinamide mononucleotide transporter PnuC